MKERTVERVIKVGGRTGILNLLLLRRQAGLPLGLPLRDYELDRTPLILSFNTADFRVFNPGLERNTEIASERSNLLRLAQLMLYILSRVHPFSRNPAGISEHKVKLRR